MTQKNYVRNEWLTLKNNIFLCLLSSPSMLVSQCYLGAKSSSSPSHKWVVYWRKVFLILLFLYLIFKIKAVWLCECCLDRRFVISHIQVFWHLLLHVQSEFIILFQELWYVYFCYLHFMIVSPKIWLYYCSSLGTGEPCNERSWVTGLYEVIEIEGWMLYISEVCFV